MLGNILGIKLDNLLGFLLENMLGSTLGNILMLGSIYGNWLNNFLETQSLYKYLCQSVKVLKN